MSEGVITMDEANVRPGFCPNCDAPIYSDEQTCIYCGGGASPRDFHAVAVISLLVLSGIGLLWLLLG